MLEQAGFIEVKVGSQCDTFADAAGEKKARRFQVYGYAFLARKPD